MVFTGKFLAKLQSYQLQLSSRKNLFCVFKKLKYVSVVCVTSSMRLRGGE